MMYYTYVMASKRNGTLNIGVTSDLVKRVYKHKNNLVAGFTSRYKVHRLVYYEVHVDITSAIHRERRLKQWQRRWKLELIEGNNPKWCDLYPDITFPPVRRIGLNRGMTRRGCGKRLRDDGKCAGENFLEK
ncbi:MAG: GIY-YIG nuclease family protein [Gammaproteobacteria bacterium]|nr:GIY-YIG nuclease family protein [Gammaproteobacteria bacterium]